MSCVRALTYRQCFKSFKSICNEVSERIHTIFRPKIKWLSFAYYYFDPMLVTILCFVCVCAFKHLGCRTNTIVHLRVCVLIWFLRRVSSQSASKNGSVNSKCRLIDCFYFLKIFNSPLQYDSLLLTVDIAPADTHCRTNLIAGINLEMQMGCSRGVSYYRFILDHSEK